jgi:hypothetical protein
MDVIININRGLILARQGTEAFIDLLKGMSRLASLCQRPQDVGTWGEAWTDRHRGKAGQRGGCQSTGRSFPHLPQRVVLEQEALRLRAATAFRTGFAGLLFSSCHSPPR